MNVSHANRIGKRVYEWKKPTPAILFTGDFSLNTKGHPGSKAAKPPPPGFQKFTSETGGFCAARWCCIATLLSGFQPQSNENHVEFRHL
ncbi:MAG: hypothetical protein IPF79_13935 [Ignavibacteria bacterium]|nr:hypothetical protein [Ignavibacteria bacterium]